MKTAIYIEDGVTQVVLTGETEFEKNTLKQFEDNQMEARIYVGSFYDCRGGWVRQVKHYGSSMNDDEGRSLMIRIGTPPKHES